MFGCENDLNRTLRELRAVRSFRDQMDSGTMRLSVVLRHDGSDINIALDKETTLRMLDDREREILKGLQFRRGDIERLAADLRELESIAGSAHGSQS